MFYIQQDLGDTILFDAIRGGRLTGVFSHDEKKMLHKTIELLADFQVKGAEGLAVSYTHLHTVRLSGNLCFYRRRYDVKPW